MEILKFEDGPTKKTVKKSSTKGLLAVAAFAAVAVLGSTLAANISLNSGSALEFGQGVAQTTACDGDGITVTPRAVFANASGAGSFNFATVSFSGIANNCANKLFTLKAYGTTSATPLAIAGSYTVATFLMSATLPGSNYILTSGYSSPSGGNGTADIGFVGTQATSGAVYKLTIETSDN